MSFSKTVLASVCIATLALASLPAIAAEGGGGGGGNMPSASAKQIDPAKRFQEGVGFLQASDFKKAEKAFGDVLDVSARDSNTNYLMALSQVGQQDFKGARKYLRTAVKYKADHVLARGWLGAVEAKLGDKEKAEEQKTALADLKTKCAGACTDSAAIDQAIAQVQKAIDDPASSLQLSALPTRLVQADAGDAAYLSAEGLLNEGRYAQALVALADAAMAFGPHPDVLTYQGFANRKLHNYDVAISFYSAALKIQPDHRGANEYLGEYYVEIGDMTKAKAQLGKLEKICKFGCEQAEELRRWIAAKS